MMMFDFIQVNNSFFTNCLIKVKVKVLGFIVCYKLERACTSQPTLHSTFLGRPVQACAFLRPLGAIHQCAAC